MVMRTAKAVVAGVGAVVTVLITVLADDVVSSEEVGTIVTAVLTVLGVYAVPNR